MNEKTTLPSSKTELKVKKDETKNESRDSESKSDTRLSCYACLIGHPSQTSHECMTDPKFYKPTARDDYLIRENYHSHMYSH